MKTLLSVLVLATTVGCASGSTSAPSDQTLAAVDVVLDQQFSLKVGQEARIAGSDLRVRFLGVVADSRCPSNVVCVWEGNAEIGLLLSGAGDATRQLNTRTEPVSIEYGGRRIRLVGLTPYPVEGRETPKNGYVAELVISE